MMNFRRIENLIKLPVIAYASSHILYVVVVVVVVLKTFCDFIARQMRAYFEINKITKRRSYVKVAAARCHRLH